MDPERYSNQIDDPGTDLLNNAIFADLFRTYEAHQKYIGSTLSGKEKKHIGAALSSGMEKKHIGAALSSGMKKKHIGAALSSGMEKKHIGAALSSGMEKKHIGAALSSGMEKKHIGAAVSVGKEKKHIGAAVSVGKEKKHIDTAFSTIDGEKRHKRALDFGKGVPVHVGENKRPVGEKDELVRSLYNYANRVDK